jgi:hypothetical protein
MSVPKASGLIEATGQLVVRDPMGPIEHNAPTLEVAKLPHRIITPTHHCVRKRVLDVGARVSVSRANK